LLKGEQKQVRIVKISNFDRAVTAKYKRKDEKKDNIYMG